MLQKLQNKSIKRKVFFKIKNPNVFSLFAYFGFVKKVIFKITFKTSTLIKLY